MRFITKIRSAAAALLVAGGLLGASLALPATALAATPDTTAVCSGVTLTGGNCSDDSSQFEKVIKLVINIISWIAGVAAVIMIVVGGFKYITSGGDSSSVSSAKNTIIYALVGLVVVALAQVIVRFVISNATK